LTTTVATPKDLLPLVGTPLGTTAWLPVPQSDIDLFAKATHDEQWIHVDPERAKDGPFGGTIAHGYLTLSLLIPLWSQLLVIENLGMAVNYGLNKVRFPAPVPAGSSLRLEATVTQVEEVGGNGIQATIDATMLCDAAPKPVCVAQMVHRYYSA
jgi:acyl dehydratase